MYGSSNAKSRAPVYTVGPGGRHADAGSVKPTGGGVQLLTAVVPCGPQYGVYETTAAPTCRPPAAAARPGATRDSRAASEHATVVAGMTLRRISLLALRIVPQIRMPLTRGEEEATDGLAGLPSGLSRAAGATRRRARRSR